MNLLDELLSKLQGVSVGASGPQFDKMSLPAADIQAGQEAMLGTLNEVLMNKLAPRMASGPITEMLQPPTAREHELPFDESRGPDLPTPKKAKANTKPAAPKDNAQEILDRWGIPKGGRVITNDPELAKMLQNQVTYLGNSAMPGIHSPAKAALPVSESQKPSIAQVNDFELAKTRQLMTSISQEQDLNKKEEMLIELRAKTGEIGANAMQQARMQAEQAVGIPQLRRQLEVRQMMDRRHPLWARYQSDSQETLAVRQQLAQAEGQVDKQVRTIMAEDPKLAAMDKSISGFLQMQERQLSGSLTRQERRQEMEESQKLQLLAETTVEQRNRLRALIPSLADKEDEDIATFLVKSKGALSKEDAAILTAQPEELVAASIQGNPSAMKVLSFEEAQRTGRSEADVQKDLRMLNKLTKDPAAIRNVAMRVYGSIDSPTFTQLNALNTMVGQGLATKEQKAQRDQLVQQLAITYQGRQVQQKLMEDASVWPIRDEAVLDAVSKVKAVTGKADIMQVAKTLLENVPTREQPAMLDRLHSEIMALGTSNKSLINQPDPDMIWSQVQAEVSKGIASRMWDSVKKANRDVQKLEDQMGFFNLRGIPQ